MAADVSPDRTNGRWLASYAVGLISAGFGPHEVADQLAAGGPLAPRHLSHATRHIDRMPNLDRTTRGRARTALALAGRSRPFGDPATAERSRIVTLGQVPLIHPHGPS